MGKEKFNELLRTRRSIRKYQDKEVEKEKVHTILQNALLAPSSRARRPWEFIAVTDRDVLEKLSKIREHGSKHIAGAPLCIIVAADPEACDVWVEAEEKEPYQESDLELDKLHFEHW